MTFTLSRMQGAGNGERDGDAPTAMLMHKLLSRGDRLPL
jgi:hypothetical protein